MLKSQPLQVSFYEPSKACITSCDMREQNDSPSTSTYSVIITQQSGQSVLHNLTDLTRNICIKEPDLI